MKDETFSESERKVLEILGRKKMTIHDLTQEFYEGDDLPFDGNNRVAGIVRRIKAKCEENCLDWDIAGEGLGRHGRTVWKESF